MQGQSAQSSGDGNPSFTPQGVSTHTSQRRIIDSATWIQALRGFNQNSLDELLKPLTLEPNDWKFLMDNWSGDAADAGRKWNAVHFIAGGEAPGPTDTPQLADNTRLKILKTLIKACPDNTVKAEVINTCDYNGRTALHLAAASRSKPFVEYLIENGAIVNSRDIWGMTPIHYAASVLCREKVVLLLESLKGADRLPYTKLLFTPADFARNAMLTHQQAQQTQNEDIVALLQKEHQQKFTNLVQSEAGSSLPMSALLVLRKDLIRQPGQPGQPINFSAALPSKPLTEKLDELTSFLQEFLNQQSIDPRSMAFSSSC